MGALWEQQPDESVKAFHAFTIYRDLPANERSYRYVSQILGLKSTGSIERWASPQAHNWGERVTAYEQYMDSLKLTVRSSDIVTAKEATLQREGEELSALTYILNKRIQDEIQRAHKSEHLDTLGMVRLVASVEKLQTMRRRNLGLPTTYRTESVEDTPPETPIFYAREDVPHDGVEEDDDV